MVTLNKPISSLNEIMEKPLGAYNKKTTSLETKKEIIAPLPVYVSFPMLN